MQQENLNLEFIFVVGSLFFFVLAGLFIFLFIRFRKTLLQKQNEFYQSLITCEVNERQKISKDIHDGLGGLLGMAKFHLTNLVDHKITPKEYNLNLETAIKLIEMASEESRVISNELLPSSIKRFGLQGALVDLVKIYNPFFEVVLIYESTDSLQKSLQANVYRILSELLNNSRKHSGASRVDIELISSIDKLLVFYSDNGNGFNFQKEMSLCQGSGLKNIENRVQLLNGKLEYSYSVGSIFNLEFPI